MKKKFDKTINYNTNINMQTYIRFITTFIHLFKTFLPIVFLLFSAFSVISGNLNSFLDWQI